MSRSRAERATSGVVAGRQGSCDHYEEATLLGFAGAIFGFSGGRIKPVWLSARGADQARWCKRSVDLRRCQARPSEIDNALSASTTVTRGRDAIGAGVTG